jgi:hypothetical protein
MPVALPRPATTHALSLATSLGESHCRFVQQPPGIPSHYAHTRLLTSSETHSLNKGQALSDYALFRAADVMYDTQRLAM